MSYYQENRPTMGGLADALALQGRRGDSTLVHMNPMEVRMLETMSPDGRLSINPETGLPEAFKLKDLAAAALPIAGSVLFPMAAPALFGASSALASPLIAGAIGTGLGGTAAGLVQGRGVGNSLIQGGLSGLMSYGLGSLSGAFAPAAPGANVPTATATDPAVVNAALGVGQPASTAVTTAAAPESTGFFGGLGETLRQTPFTDVPSVGSPTYGSMLGSGASGLLSSALLAPEEMPYDIAGMDDMDAYYAGRVPDLGSGRLRGQAAARQLKSPPSFLTSGGLYERAISPGGGGTFFAADGGQVPSPYGDPYGPGDPYGGVSDESNAGQSSNTGPGMSLGSFNEPVADLGLGAFNPTPMSLSLTALGMVPGPIGMIANIANIGRGLAGLGQGVQTSPTGQTQVSGYGNETMDMFGNVVGTPEHTANLLGYSPTDPMNSKLNFNYATVSDVSPDEVAAQQAIADFAEAHGQEVGDASPGGGMSSDEAATDAAESGQDGPGGHMAQGGVVDFYAQGGGISSLAYGGEAAPVGFANKAFEGMVPGDGTGMSDDVPFSIEGNQPALLSRDEYVLPADIVSQLGDGSSGAGADMLDNFISQVRQTKYGNTQQPAPVGPQLMTGLMRQGGVV